MAHLESLEAKERQTLLKAKHPPVRLSPLAKVEVAVVEVAVKKAPLISAVLPDMSGCKTLLVKSHETGDPKATVGIKTKSKSNFFILEN